MKVTGTLIEGFFRNELNEYQHSVVKEYFRQNPEALQKYLTEKSWEDFDPTEQLAAPITDKMLRVIETRAYKTNKTRRIFYQWASVAAVVSIVSFSYYLLTNKAASVPPVPRENRLAEEVPKWRNEANRTGKILQVSLEDGTQVELSKGSVLHYREHFAKDKRDIYLTGSALFKVGKDAARPFTVYSGHLHITALGTVFKVAEPAGENKKTEVYLLSGKVVVRPDSLLEKNGIKETYLDPGQLLQLDPQKFIATLSRYGNNTLAPNKLAIPALKRIFTFDNEPLADIFKELGTCYKIRFVYKQHTLKDMTFTGKFNNQKETLENFLSTLTTLNNLTVKHEKNSIYIN